MFSKPFFLMRRILFVFSGLLFLQCNIPHPPVETASVSVLLKSSDGRYNNSTITDSTGTEIEIGIVFHFKEFIDSVRINVFSEKSVEYSFLWNSGTNSADTVFFPVSFDNPGTRSVVVTGYRTNQENYISTGEIIIFNRRTENQNQKPSISVPGLQTIGAGQTLSFFVTATGPDNDSQITIKAIKKPEKATFSDNAFRWIPALADTGRDTVIFVASNNSETIALSDTGFVIIVISAEADSSADPDSVRTRYENDTIKPTLTRVNPSSDSVKTNASSYTITVYSTDSSSILSVKGALGSQVFDGSRSSDDIWTITISGLIENSDNTIVITATDSSLKANQSILMYHVKYDPSMNDSDGPTIKQISGPSSGDIISDNVITIIDTIFDPSGIDSVFWTLNGGTEKQMHAVEGKAGQYSLTETLSKENINTILITAVDKSAQHNRTQQTIELNYVIAPEITMHAQSEQLCSGSSATVSVTATGTAPITYQWRNSDGNITNAISASYTIHSLTETTILTCKVSNAAGTSITSYPCTLTVNPQVTVTVTPANAQVCSGDSVIFTANAAGGNNFKYQWYKGTPPDGVPETNETAATLTVSATDAEAGSYYCVVSNDFGCTGTSNTVEFSRNQDVTLKISSTGTALCSGDSLILTATPTGGTGHSYQWYSGATKVGTNHPKYIRYIVKTGGTYRCIATSSTGCSGSDQITITLKTPPSKPASITADSSLVCSGTTVKLSVNGTLSGTNAKWVWYKDNTNANSQIGVGSNIEPIVNATGRYIVRAEGDCGFSDTVSKQIVVRKEAIAAKITGIPTDTICPGTEVKLFLEGGYSGDGGKWVWRKSLVDGEMIATNLSSITVYPTVTTNYYLVAEGGCNKVWTQARVIVGSPTITSQTQGPIIGPKAANPNGTHIDLEVKVTGGSGSYSYEWFFDGITIPVSILGEIGTKYSGGWNSAQFGFVAFRTNYSGIYHCVIKDEITGCTIKSEDIEVIITDN